MAVGPSAVAASEPSTVQVQGFGPSTMFRLTARTPAGISAIRAGRKDTLEDVMRGAEAAIDLCKLKNLDGKSAFSHTTSYRLCNFEAFLHCLYGRNDA